MLHFPGSWKCGTTQSYSVRNIRIFILTIPSGMILNESKHFINSRFLFVIVVACHDDHYCTPWKSQKARNFCLEAMWLKESKGLNL